MKKTIQISLLIIMVLLISFLLWYFNLSDENCLEKIRCGNNLKIKESVIFSYFDKVVLFNIPISWNAFINGDPEYIIDIDNYFDRRNIVYSISTSDRPITHTDINWEQLDFYLTDGNLISDEFVNSMREMEGKTFNEFQLDDFIGYSITDILDFKIPNKADTGGTIYYLIPKIDSVTWNLIINKQSLGSDEFNTQVKDIINSLDLRDYDEYINELNK